MIPQPPDTLAFLNNAFTTSVAARQVTPPFFLFLFFFFFFAGKGNKRELRPLRQIRVTCRYCPEQSRRRDCHLIVVLRQLITISATESVEEGGSPETRPRRLADSIDLDCKGTGWRRARRKLPCIASSGEVV